MLLRKLCVLLVFLLLAGIWQAPAQEEEKAARELIEKAFAEVQRNPANGRGEAERLVREALELLRKAPAVSRERFAEGLVLFSLLMLGEDRPVDSYRPQVEEALRIYENAARPVDDSRIALALEVLSASSGTSTDEAQRLRERSTAIRQREVAARRARDGDGDLTLSTDIRRIGGGVTPPTLREKQEPFYSEEARFARRQGSALLSIVIDTNGQPRNITVVRSLGFGLDEAAYEAVRTWQFQPAIADGQPVAVSANVEVNFRLL